MTRYSYLGPAGTFTEAALRKIASPSDELIAYGNVTSAFDAVRKGEVDKALVPIENSVEGVVARTLDELALGDELIISGETSLPVTFAFMAKADTDPSEIKTIATHPHAEAQTRGFISQNYPKAQLIEAPSTAAGARGVAEGKFDGAIAARVAAENYGLKVLNDNIGDNDAAVTRFIIVEKPGSLPAPTGKDRTSLVTYIDIDHAGALLEILTEFAKQNVNLTFIQSRPTGRQLGHYHFIIDAEGHIHDAPVKAAIDGLRAICDDVRFLGSYPRTVG